MSKALLHKRSVVVESGRPKLPTSAQTEYGEIAINYAEGYETLSIRNNNDGIATFSSDSQIDAKINTRISGITLNGTALTVSGGVVDLGTIESGNNITGVTINGTAATVSGGVVDLGYFIERSKEYIISSSLNDLNSRVIELSASTSGKQETLVSGTNIKTINNESILGSGNITIQGGSGSSYTAGSGININNNNVISVTGKQETLVSGTNIKTINNESILGSGNITIQGGGGGGAEYTAGTNIDITNYVISVTGLSAYELTANKATTISSASTHTEYASAKAVYDFVGDIDAALNTILTGATS